MLTKAAQQKVREILLRVITDKATSWWTIREAVAFQMTIKNWLDVRAVLQRLIDEQLVRRTNTIRREEYIKEPVQ